MVCHWADAEEPLRVGFVVSKAVGPAVVRNKVKRRLRHGVRGILSRRPAPRGLLVVRALPASAQADESTLVADLERGLDRVGWGSA